jgi:hypothetical protein
MNINLHIEQLTLDGLAITNHDRPALQAAIEAELGTLLTNGGLGPALQEGGAVPSMPGGSIQLSAESGSAAMGRQIAQAVYEGIGQ